MSRTHQYAKDFEVAYAEYKVKKEAALKVVNDEWNTWANKWLKDVCPFNIGDVLEIVDNKRMKLQRMVIYDFQLQIFDKFPIIHAWGWWMDKSSTPVKWGSYPVVNCQTNYKMELSSDQTNHPVKQ